MELKTFCSPAMVKTKQKISCILHTMHNFDGTKKNFVLFVFLPWLKQNKKKSVIEIYFHNEYEIKAEQTRNDVCSDINQFLYTFYR